jgi:hypothetical protein
MVDTSMSGVPAASEESRISAASSAVSWAAVIAGGVAASAVTLLMLAFGTGMGFAVVSPWPNSGISAATFSVWAGLYLVAVAMIAFGIGGYLAGRLRTSWIGVHTHEVYFRDTAHGFLAWAFATVLSAAVLSAAASNIVAGASAGISYVAGAAAGQSAAPIDGYLDSLLRADPARPRDAGQVASSRAELSRLLTAGFRSGSDLGSEDRTYIAQVVAARTGVTQADAEKRVADVILRAKTAMDNARKAALHLALWLTASLLIGAFSASLAATEGGGLRDGTWK